MEIERKFLVKSLPDFGYQKSIWYERYYLERGNGIEKRIQKKGDKYEFEELNEISELTRDKVRKEISEAEFNKLKADAKESIIRESYLVQDFKPEISIKIYHGKYEGLIRAEIEFASEEDAINFEQPNWFGAEITNTPLGRDSRLLDLTSEAFKELLRKFLLIESSFV